MDWSHREFKMKKLISLVLIVSCIFLMCSCDPNAANAKARDIQEKAIESFESDAFANTDTSVEIGGVDQLIR